MDSRQPLNLIGGGFHHVPSSCGFEPLHMRWVKHEQSSPVSVYVDDGLTSNINPNTMNFGCLMESKTIIPNIYEWCKLNIPYLKENFINVFTHDTSLIELSDVFKLNLTGCRPFIYEGEIYEKRKLVSIISSNKKMCKEHVMRLEIVDKYKDRCDLFGRGFNYIEDKRLGLKDYCFSFAIENGSYPNMFSEKITDCFITGTIPIFLGTPNIVDFFNSDGIIILDNKFNFNDLSFELYKSKLEAVRENYEITKNLLCVEDYMYINFIKPELEKNGI